MKIWVSGGSGHLGSYVAGVARRDGHSVLATDHHGCSIDVESKVALRMVDFKPDVIINCAGSVPPARPVMMAKGNTLGPHVLASYGTRLVHVSTDCVFDGNLQHPARYRVWDGGFSSTIYGMTKRAGESELPHVLNIRTSFIGPGGGLLKWLLDQPAGALIEGWAEAYWTGTTVQALARVLVSEAVGTRTGIHHAASPDSVSKHWLLSSLIQQLELDVKILPASEPKVNRALNATIELPPIRETLLKGVMEKVLP